jgi:hypothetical protein
VAILTQPMGALPPAPPVKVEHTLKEALAWKETLADTGYGDELVQRIIAAGGYAAILEDPAKQRDFSDQLDSIVPARMINVRNALRELGWAHQEGRDPWTDLYRGDYRFMTLARSVSNQSWNVASYSITVYPKGSREAVFKLAADLIREPARELARRIDQATRPQDEQMWHDTLSPMPLVSAFMSEFAGDSVADILAAVDHQLSTDSDLDDIAGAEKYRALRQGIREAMAQKLGYAGYQPREGG